MGYYLQVDLQDAVPVASLSGWGDIIRWVGGLPPTENALHHFVHFGYTERVTEATDQIRAALKTSPPASEQTRKTADNLLSMLEDKAQKADIISVTDGIG